MKRKNITRVELDERGRIIGSSKHRQSRTDWQRVDALSDADIRKAAAHDRDSPLLTARDLKKSWHVPAKVDVGQLRKSMHLSQTAFARKYGFSVGAVQDWEQGRVSPTRSARVLLIVIGREPAAVDRALREAAGEDDDQASLAAYVALAQSVFLEPKAASTWRRVRAKIT